MNGKEKEKGCKVENKRKSEILIKMHH